MGKAVAAATACVRTPIEGVRAAVRERLGDERFAVWFGDAAWTFATGSGTEVVVCVGSGVTHQWLQRTFHEDVQAAVRSICGPGAGVVWQPASEADPRVEESSRQTSPDRSRRRPKRESEPDRAHPPTAISVRPAEALKVVVDEPDPSTSVAPQSRRNGRGLGEFIVGGCNRMAFAAVEIAASRPGEISPLVIHGPGGVGKTHLLELACSRARGFQPGSQTVFLSAEQFTTSFLHALHGRALPGFRRSIRSADMLVVDDLQFFIGKRATIQEFQQTIDAFFRQGKQVIVAADRDLDALSELGSEILGRLRGGMTARLLPPDYDVRRGIVTALSRSRGLAFPDDVIHHVAVSMTRHARELAGAVNRLEATSHMLGMPVTLDLAEEALTDLVRSSSRSIRLADIERAVCTAFGISEGGLQVSKRSRAVSHPRMLAMFLARKHTRAALAEIGGYFGKRSHSTVVTAQKTVSLWMSDKTPIVLGGVAWDVAEAIRHVEDILRGA
jgi:chromosomal replication initiator protein